MWSVSCDLIIPNVYNERNDAIGWNMEWIHLLSHCFWNCGRWRSTRWSVGGFRGKSNEIIFITNLKCKINCDCQKSIQNKYTCVLAGYFPSNRRKLVLSVPVLKPPLLSVVEGSECLPPACFLCYFGACMLTIAPIPLHEETRCQTMSSLSLVWNYYYYRCYY
jgi:hypothetical protein